MSDKGICFVIAPIGEDDSPTRKRSDQVLEHIIRPAVETECGYEAIRADEISEPGMITRQVIEHIVNDPLVVADLTEHNPNVFYELALRHALRKPLVQLIQDGEKIPFDVADARTIFVNHQDLDSAAKAQKELVKQVHSFHDGEFKFETPISVALDLSALRGSEDPDQRQLGQLLEVIVDLKKRVAVINAQLRSPETLLPLEYVREIAQILKTRDPDRLAHVAVYLEHARRQIQQYVALAKNPQQNLDEMADSLSELSDGFKVAISELRAAVREG